MKAADTLKILKDYADRRLNEVIESGTVEEITYWHGYRDAVAASIRTVTAPRKLQTSNIRKDEKPDEDNKTVI